MSNYPEGVAMPFLDEAPDYVECDECGQEVGANEVATIDDRTICDDCNPNWPPQNLTDVAKRKHGLRENGEAS